MTDKILRCREVQHAIGLSRSTIYRMVERGDFPPPQKLGLRAIGWRESAISDWIGNPNQSEGFSSEQANG